MSHPTPAETWPAVVVMQPADGIRPPLGELATGLAQHVVSVFGDDVLQLVGVDGTGEPRLVPGNPARLEVPLPPEPTAACEAVLAAITAYARPYAYTVVDVSSRSLGFLDLLVAFLGRAPMPLGVHRRLLRLRRTPPPYVAPAPDDAPGWTVLATVFLETDEGKSLGAWLADRASVRLGWKPPPSGATRPNPRPGPDRVSLPEEVRVLQLWGTSVDRGESWARWVRAVTRRRVGVALGGSGAWGFSHVALLQELGKNRVPVDLLSAASSGSVIGAYYAVLGPRGLEVVLNRGWRLDFAVTASLFSTGWLELIVGLDTGFPPLQSLELQYYPVTTNLTTMSSDRVVHASVPWGVRASSTAPGLFAPTATLDAVYVDGAVADNVPSELLSYLGASLVVASNALPAPADIRRPSTCTLLFDPFFRTRELGQSLSLMFHDVGDWESVGAICYDPPQTAYPLMRTFMFNQAKQVYRETLAEPSFQRAIARSREAWERLARPRTGL